MIWIAIVFIVIIAVAVFVLKLPSSKQAPSVYPYQNAGVLFTPAERSFFGVLKQSVGEEIEVFGKVRVADVITPQKGLSPSARQKAFNKISAKHFDFLLCNKSDLTVICAVELNDSSHKATNRAERDVFLLNACKSANIPLLQIPAKNVYSINEIKEHLGVYKKDKTSTAVPEDPKETREVQSEKRCPKCSSGMVRRVAKQGQNIRKELWACCAYPKCKHIEPIMNKQRVHSDALKSGA
jgi:hypothetical protein